MFQDISHLADVLVIEFGHAPDFFPPRLQVVVEKQNPDGSPADAWNQTPFYGFLSYQT
jgi:hypothetical protein